MAVFEHVEVNNNKDATNIDFAQHCYATNFDMPPTLLRHQCSCGTV